MRLACLLIAGAVYAQTFSTHEAEKLLKSPIYSVMDKDKAGPSGDKHDYVSYAPYWWPDPGKPNGLPYIRKDGHTNRELRAKGDANHFSETMHGIEVLTQAMLATGEAAYGENAVERVRAWFLNPATRMNPNLEYGQAIMGRTDGRGAGLVTMRGLIPLTFCLKDLKRHKLLTNADDNALRAWLREYLQWLEAGKIGQDEWKAKDNHGSWYAAQAMALEIYLGEKAKAKKRAEQLKPRIGWQIEPGGRQPLETERQDGFSYSVFNLEALATVAKMAKPLGVDLWQYKTADGRSLRMAFEYLEPFAAGTKAWPFRQLKRIEPNALAKIRQLRDKHEE